MEQGGKEGIVVRHEEVYRTDPKKGVSAREVGIHHRTHYFWVFTHSTQFHENNPSRTLTMSAYGRPLPFLPIQITDDETSPRVTTLFGKRSFETPTQREDSPTQLQDETKNYVLKPSVVLKPKRRRCTPSSMEQSSDSVFISSPHCFQPRRSSRSSVHMPSSIQHFNRQDLAEDFHHSRPRFLPLLPQECDGNSNMMPPQEFLMFRRTSLPRDLQGWVGCINIIMFGASFDEWQEWLSFHMLKFNI